MRPNRFIWLGTHKPFDAFTFDFRRTEHGWFQAHIYKFDRETSTFIVETTEEAFAAHRLGELDQQGSIDFCEKLFAETLDGAKLMTNARHLRGSAWLNFNRLICGKWSRFNGRSHVVLMGDAAHTAHFAIGSGTKLALDDAIELAEQFDRLGHGRETIGAGARGLRGMRRVDVARIQNAARNAMEWFEVVGRRYADTLEPEQFFYSMLTRSQRISHENLRLRDPAWLEGYEHWFAARSGVAGAGEPSRAAADADPLQDHADVMLANRIVVSPMAMYSAHDGLINDFHIAHLGARAMGGAALVFAEMTCVSPDARITPGCLGLWNDEQQAQWKRLVDLIHSVGHAKAGIQLGHAGRKGSTRLAWEGIDEPLAQGNWPLISASALPYLPQSQTPRAMTRADMERVRDDFVAAAKRAAAAGVDVLELHCAHGYLLSSFLSPLTNRRDDEYGGSHEEPRALSARSVPRRARGVAAGEADFGPALLSRLGRGRQHARRRADLRANVQGGRRGSDRLLVGSGCGRMNIRSTAACSRRRSPIRSATRGMSRRSRSARSRRPITPIPIIAAGRADLCAFARPHLADPAWTMHEAAKIGASIVPWPKQYTAREAQYEAEPREGGDDELMSALRSPCARYRRGLRHRRCDRQGACRARARA